eukprot:TRINITY_DN9215_c0_g1_i9.p1 TRINITY_DN9215_c0_g1~~TRINITY_DN9215_c0_g1_i9.p1  ORF type:complete len:680 (+),score=278.42 TRINITY_DN9215_c0_g1_i9:911-2950(+)
MCSAGARRRKGGGRTTDRSSAATAAPADPAPVCPRPESGPDGVWQQTLTSEESCQRLRTELKEQRALVAFLFGLYARMRGKAAAERAETRGLRERLDAATALADRRSSELSDAARESSQWRTDTGEAQKQVAELRDQLGSIASELERVRECCRIAEDGRDKWEAVASDADSTVLELQAERDELRGALEQQLCELKRDLIGDLRREKKRKAEVSVSLQESEEKTEGLSAELESARARLAELEAHSGHEQASAAAAEAQQLRSELAAVEQREAERRSEAHKELSAAHAATLAARKECDALRAAAKDAGVKTDGDRARLRKAEADLASAARDIAKRDAAHQKLERELAQRKSDAKKDAEALSESRAQAAAMKGKLDSADAARGAAERDLAAARQQLAAAKQVNAKLMESGVEVEAVAEELAAARADTRQIAAELAGERRLRRDAAERHAATLRSMRQELDDARRGADSAEVAFTDPSDGTGVRLRPAPPSGVRFAVNGEWRQCFSSAVLASDSDGAYLDIPVADTSFGIPAADVDRVVALLDSAGVSHNLAAGGELTSELSHACADDDEGGRGRGARDGRGLEYDLQQLRLRLVAGDISDAEFRKLADAAVARASSDEDPFPRAATAPPPPSGRGAGRGTAAPPPGGRAAASVPAGRGRGQQQQQPQQPKTLRGGMRGRGRN